MKNKKEIPKFVYFVNNYGIIEGPFLEPKKDVNNRKFLLTEVFNKKLKEKNILKIIDELRLKESKK